MEGWEKGGKPSTVRPDVHRKTQGSNGHIETKSTHCKQICRPKNRFSSRTSYIHLLVILIPRHCVEGIVLLAIWQCCWLSGSTTGYLAMLLTMWCHCWLSDSAASYLAVPLDIWQYCWLSGNVVGSTVGYLAIWQYCWLSGCAVYYLAVLLAI